MYTCLTTFLSNSCLTSSVSDFTACFTQLHEIAVWTFNNVRLLNNYYLWPGPAYDCLMISLWRYFMFHTLHMLAPSTAYYKSPSPPSLRHGSSLSSIFIPVGTQNTFSVKKWCGQEKLKGLVPSGAGYRWLCTKNLFPILQHSQHKQYVQDDKISKRMIDQVFIDKPFK